MDQTASCGIGSGAALRTGAVRWTGSDNILVRWSAGSDDKFAELYDVSCNKLLDVDATCLVQSPNERYLVALPCRGAPLATLPQAVTVFDLHLGRQVGETSSKLAIRYVRRLVWKKRHVEVSFVSMSNREGHVVMHLK